MKACRRVDSSNLNLAIFKGVRILRQWRVRKGQLPSPKTAPMKPSFRGSFQIFPCGERLKFIEFNSLVSKSQAKQPLSDAASTDMLGEKVSPIAPMVLPQATPLTRAVKHSKKFSSSPSSIFPFEYTSRAHKLFHGAAQAELVVASLVVVVVLICYQSRQNKSIRSSQVDPCVTSPRKVPLTVEGDGRRHDGGSQSGIKSGKIASVSAEERVGDKINSNPPALRNSISKKKSELFAFHSSNCFHLKFARNIKLKAFSPVGDGRILHRGGKRPLLRHGFIVCGRLAIYFPASHTECHHHHCGDRQQKMDVGGNSRGTITVRSSALKASCHETTKSTSKFSSYQFQNADSTSLLSTICTGRRWYSRRISRLSRFKISPAKQDSFKNFQCGFLISNECLISKEVRSEIGTKTTSLDGISEL